jgi:hypothetical protein
MEREKNEERDRERNKQKWRHRQIYEQRDIDRQGKSNIHLPCGKVQAFMLEDEKESQEDQGADPKKEVCHRESNPVGKVPSRLLEACGGVIVEVVVDDDEMTMMMMMMMMRMMMMMMMMMMMEIAVEVLSKSKKFQLPQPIRGWEREIVAQTSPPTR